MPMGMVQKLLDAITQASTNPSIEYPKDIKNLPIFFPAAPHSHPLETLEQIELLNMALRDVHNALINRVPMIESGNSHQEQIDRILGLIAGMWAEKFDQLAAFQNFLILPLTMLSGVFYSVQSLPAFWQELSRMNPLVYLIDGFRFGFFAVSDASPWLSFGVALGFTAAIGLLSFILLVRGYKLRT